MSTNQFDLGSGGGEGLSTTLPPPTKQLGFEINPTEREWNFIPEIYPTDFTQMKKRELNRYGGGCSGETVSIEVTKNRELHVSGKILFSEVRTVQDLMDIDSEVDVISPLIPGGGLECFIKQAEIGNYVGYDPHTGQRMFKYTLDLVSTGRDENDSGENAIVTAIFQEATEAGDGYYAPGQD